MLIHNGADIKDIQTWVGHSDIQTAMNIYAQTNKYQKNKTADIRLPYYLFVFFMDQLRDDIGSRIASMHESFQKLYYFKSHMTGWNDADPLFDIPRESIQKKLKKYKEHLEELPTELKEHASKKD